jgi:transposase
MTREEAKALVYGNPEAAVDLIVELVATVAALRARVAELERKIALLSRDSSNCSKPPSSDGPFAKPKARPPKKSKKRKRGGQPGHKGKNRDLIPIDEVDVVEEILPEMCGHCHRHLATSMNPEEGKYFRYQMVDIPESKPHVTEYRLRCIRCECGAETWAELPGIARSGFGPRLTALAAYLTGAHRVTRRGLVDIFKTIFGIDISLGSICNLHEEVSRALEPSYEEIKKALPQQSVLNVDETGWRSMGRPIWLWIFVARSLALFTLLPSRGAGALKGVLGDIFEGILCSDRFSAYGSYHKGLRQVCWAHIIREIKGIRHACRSPDAVKFSRWMLSEVGRMFALFNAFRSELLDRKTLALKSVPLRARMSNCLQMYEVSGDPDVARMARGLLKYWDSLFTFLEHNGVEPTNNVAERGIRPAVQWRKICFGNQSHDGELLTARLLTVTRTCLLQEKSPFQYLVDALKAYRCGFPHPSLVNTSR